MWAILELSKTTYTSLYFWEVIHNHILYLPQSHDNGNFVIDFSDFDLFFFYIWELNQEMSNCNFRGSIFYNLPSWWVNEFCFMMVNSYAVTFSIFKSMFITWNCFASKLSLWSYCICIFLFNTSAYNYASNLQ